MMNTAFLLPFAAPAFAENDSGGMRSMNAKSAIPVPNGANGLAKVLGAAVLGIVILIAVVALLRGRQRFVACDKPKKDPPPEDVERP